MDNVKILLNKGGLSVDGRALSRRQRLSWMDIATIALNKGGLSVDTASMSAQNRFNWMNRVKFALSERGMSVENAYHKTGMNIKKLIRHTPDKCLPLLHMGVRIPE